MLPLLSKLSASAEIVLYFCFLPLTIFNKPEIFENIDPAKDFKKALLAVLAVLFLAPILILLVAWLAVIGVFLATIKLISPYLLKKNIMKKSLKEIVEEFDIESELQKTVQITYLDISSEQASEKRLGGGEIEEESNDLETEDEKHNEIGNSSSDFQELKKSRQSVDIQQETPQKKTLQAPRTKHKRGDSMDQLLAEPVLVVDTYQTTNPSPTDFIQADAYGMTEEKAGGVDKYQGALASMGIPVHGN